MYSRHHIWFITIFIKIKLHLDKYHVRLVIIPVINYFLLIAASSNFATKQEEITDYKE